MPRTEGCCIECALELAYTGRVRCLSYDDSLSLTECANVLGLQGMHAWIDSITWRCSAGEIAAKKLVKALDTNDTASGAQAFRTCLARGSEMLNSWAFLDLPEAVVAALLSREELQVDSELDVVLAIVRWARVRLGCSPVDSANASEMAYQRGEIASRISKRLTGLERDISQLRQLAGIAERASADLRGTEGSWKASEAIAMAVSESESGERLVRSMRRELDQVASADPAAVVLADRKTGALPTSGADASALSDQCTGSGSGEQRIHAASATGVALAAAVDHEEEEIVAAHAAKAARMLWLGRSAAAHESDETRKRLESVFAPKHAGWEMPPPPAEGPGSRFAHLANATRPGTLTPTRLGAGLRRLLRPLILPHVRFRSLSPLQLVSDRISCVFPEAQMLRVTAVFSLARRLCRGFLCAGQSHPPPWAPHGQGIFAADRSCHFRTQYRILWPVWQRAQIWPWGGQDLDRVHTGPRGVCQSCGDGGPHSTIAVVPFAASFRTWHRCWSSAANAGHFGTSPRSPHSPVQDGAAPSLSIRVVAAWPRGHATQCS